MRNRIANILVTLLLFLPPAVVGSSVAVISVAACRTVHVATVPSEVRTVIDLRLASLAQVGQALSQGALDQAAFTQVMREENAAWSYLRTRSSGWTTPADFASAMQTQVIGTQVAAEKSEAGEFTPEQQAEMIAALRTAWSAVETYFKKAH